MADPTSPRQASPDDVEHPSTPTPATAAPAPVQCHVKGHVLHGVRGEPGCVLYTGAALRRDLFEQSPNGDAAPAFEITPHGEGKVELLSRRPPRPSSVRTNPGGRPRARTALNTEESTASAASVETMVSVSFEGHFSHGQRFRWGTLTRTVRTSGPPATPMSETWSVHTLSCLWDADVPQLLSDPCSLQEDEERLELDPDDDDDDGTADPRRRTRWVYTGLAMAVQDAASPTPQPTSSNAGGRRKSGNVSPPQEGRSRAATTPPTAGGFSNGLAWALRTRFLPDGLGERVDLVAGQRYCGEWQCGQRHGFGIVTSASTHEAQYIGMFDCDQRHGAGSSLDEARRLTFDGVWESDHIATSGGTLHLPPPSPLAIQGQKWSSATAVATGFLVRARSGLTGMWEPLLVLLDEALPALLPSLESVAAAMCDRDSAASSPANVSTNGFEPGCLHLRKDSTATESAATDLSATAPGSPMLPSSSSAISSEDAEAWKLWVGSSVARFDPVVVFVRSAKLEMNRVRYTAMQALTLGVARRALTAFQRCMLFLYGSCAAPPVVECGAGESVYGRSKNGVIGNKVGTLATSWCRLCGSLAAAYNCQHRNRRGTTITPVTLQHAVQAASSIAMSLRLRLMTCYSATAMSQTPTTTPPCSRSRLSTPPPGNSPASAAMEPLPPLRPDTPPLILRKGAARCPHCALEAFVHVARYHPYLRHPLPPASDRGWTPPPHSALAQHLDLLHHTLGAVLSGRPVRNAANALVSTTWDTVAASVLPLLLTIARPAFAQQTGRLACSLRRIALAANRRKISAPSSPKCPSSSATSPRDVATAAAELLLPEAAVAACNERVVQVATTFAWKGLLRVDRLSHHPSASDLQEGAGCPAASPLGRLASTLRLVSQAVIHFGFPSPESLASEFRHETTDLGPHFTYYSVHPGSADSGSSAGSGSPRRGKWNAGSYGIVTSRIEALTRLVLYCRLVALELLAAMKDRQEDEGSEDDHRASPTFTVPIGSDANRSDGGPPVFPSVALLTQQLLRLVVFFASGSPALLQWLHVLLRICSAPTSAASTEGSDSCGHDAGDMSGGSSMSAAAAAAAHGPPSVGDASGALSLPTSAVVTLELSPIGAWALWTTAAAVERLCDGVPVAHTSAVEPATVAQVTATLDALFCAHLPMPLRALAAGHASPAGVAKAMKSSAASSKRSQSMTDAGVAKDTSKKGNSEEPRETIIVGLLPNVAETREELSRLHPAVAGLVRGDVGDATSSSVDTDHTDQTTAPYAGNDTFDVEDTVLLSISDWALGIVSDHNVAPTNPQVRVFSVGAVELPRRDEDPGASGSTTPGSGPTPRPRRSSTVTPAPPSVHTDPESASLAASSIPASSPVSKGSPTASEAPLDAYPPPPRGAFSSRFTSAAAEAGSRGLQRCYVGGDEQLLVQRLQPLVDVLESVGLRLDVLQVAGPASPSEPGSPGVGGHVAATSSLQLRIALRGEAKTPGGANDPCSVPVVDSRRGSLTMPPLLVDRVLCHWRSLRRRVVVARPAG